VRVDYTGALGGAGRHGAGGASEPKTLVF